MNIVKYGDRKEQAKQLAASVSIQLDKVLQNRHRATLAVAGGTTPGLFFQALSEQNLPWNRVTVIATDERWVDEDSERSNAKLIKTELLIGKAQKASFVSLYSQTIAESGSVETLNKALEHSLMPIDVCVLGMGADAHTASLFPNSNDLSLALSDQAPTALIMQLPTNEKRITLSAPTLKSSQHLHVLIQGKEKQKTLETLEGRTEAEAPILCVLSLIKTVVHYAD